MQGSVSEDGEVNFKTNKNDVADVNNEVLVQVVKLAEDEVKTAFERSKHTAEVEREPVSKNPPNSGEPGKEDSAFPNTPSSTSKEESPITETSEGEAGILLIQSGILDNLADIPGIVILNETTIPQLLNDPDTVLIGQEIVIGPDGGVMLSTSIQGDSMAPVNIVDLPTEIQAAVEDALKEVLADKDLSLIHI